MGGKVFPILFGVGAATSILAATSAKAEDCVSLNGAQYAVNGGATGGFFSAQLNNGQIFTLNVGDAVTTDYTLQPGSNAEVRFGLDQTSARNDGAAEAHIAETFTVPDSGGDGSPTSAAFDITGFVGAGDLLLIDFLCDPIVAGNEGFDSSTAAAQSNAFVETTAIGFGGDLAGDFGIPGFGDFNPGLDVIAAGGAEEEDERDARKRRARDAAGRLRRGEPLGPGELQELQEVLEEDVFRNPLTTGETPVFPNEGEALQALIDQAERFNAATDTLEDRFNGSDDSAGPSSGGIAGDTLVDLLERFSDAVNEATGGGAQNDGLGDLFDKNRELQEESEFLDGDGDIRKAFEEARQERQALENGANALEAEIDALRDIQDGFVDEFGPPLQERFSEQELADPEAAIAERRRRQQQLNDRNRQIDTALNDKVQAAAERLGVEVDSRLSADDDSERFDAREDLRNLQNARDQAAERNNADRAVNEVQINEAVQDQTQGVDQTILDQAAEEAARDFSGFGETEDTPPPQPGDLQAFAAPSSVETAFSSFTLSPLPGGAAFAYQVQPPADPRWDVWVEGQAAFSEDNRHGMESDSTSIVLKAGARYRIDPDWAAGGALRYSHNESDQADGSAAFESDAFGVAAFVQTQALAGIDVQATLAYERGAVDAAFNGATGDFSFDAFSGEAVASRAVPLSPNWTLTPNAGLSYTIALRDGYRLSDGSQIDGDTLSQGSARLGARLSGDYAFHQGPVMRVAPSLGAAATWNFAPLEPGQLADGSRVDAADFGLTLDLGLTAEFEGGASLSLNGGASQFDGGDQIGYFVGAQLTIPLN